jgi:hypothetical protein
MHFVSEASKHAKHRFLMPTEVEPDIPIRRVFTFTIHLWQVWMPALRSQLWSAYHARGMTALLQL